MIIASKYTKIIFATEPFLQRNQERLIEEKEERIKDLTREVTTLNGFAHYFKTAEVKQIEVPAAERKKPWWRFW